jgi:hydrogenase-4 component B
MNGASIDLSSSTLLQFALCAYSVGVFGSLAALRRERLANLLGFGSATVASICGIAAALLALTIEPAAGARTFEVWPALIPWVKLAVKLDPLSAFFVLIVSVLGLALSIYSFGYVRGFYGRKSVGALGAFYNALLLATTLVFTASNALFFLIAWEIMALTAYC